MNKNELQQEKNRLENLLELCDTKYRGIFMISLMKRLYEEKINKIKIQLREVDSA